MKKYTVSISVEKILTYDVFAESDEQAIELANQRAMNSIEDFATILDSCVIKQD